MDSIGLFFWYVSCDFQFTNKRLPFPRGALLKLKTMKEIKTKATGRSRDRGKRKVRKNGFLRFQLALIIALALVYGGLEASFEYLVPTAQQEQMPQEELTEWIPEKFTVEVPKPQSTTVRVDATRLGPEIEVVPDNTVIQEPIDTCTDCDGDPDVDDIDYQPADIEPLTVPLTSALEELPVFPGCENVSKEERFDCFNKQINKHVRRVFRYPERDMDLGNEGKVYVKFRINEFGEVDQIEYRGQGTSETLDQEAYRIISKLPQMKPGKIAGKPIRVTYTIPITFRQNN